MDIWAFSSGKRIYYVTIPIEIGDRLRLPIPIISKDGMQRSVKVRSYYCGFPPLYRKHLHHTSN